MRAVPHKIFKPLYARSKVEDTETPVSEAAREEKSPKKKQETGHHQAAIQGIGRQEEAGHWREANRNQKTKTTNPDRSRANTNAQTHQDNPSCQPAICQGPWRTGG